MHFLKQVTIFCVFGYVHCSLTEEYYEELINERMAKAESYKLPEKSEEFGAGVKTDIVNDFGRYDFVIIGAGSAGSVLATRLSEVDDFNILLLEAGGEEDDFSSIPGVARYLQFSEMNWGYYTTPQKNCCLGMKEQKCIVPRGKVIGGSSTINAVMYVRGNPKDYDKWVELGNPGWSYKEVLPYFKKSENTQIHGDAGYHGKGGLWNVEFSLPNSPLLTNFFDANLALNKSFVDYNGRNQLGFDPVQYNIKRGRRQSTGTAFLNNARKRKNLKIITKALVTKIHICPIRKVALGVEFVTQNRKFLVNATKEILLSGGAINSPQILMLSGIGPKDQLEQLGITVIADLPVGKNLLEHPLFSGLVFSTNYSIPAPSLKEQVDDYLKGLGSLTKAAGINSIGFIHTGDTSTQVPTIEYLFVQANGNSSWSTSKAYNYDDELVYNFVDKINPTGSIIISLVLLHEKSRGRVTLKSTNPTDFPNIDLNMFAEREDVDSMIEGIEFVLKLAETDAFKQIDARLVDIPICGKFAKYSKQFWECVIRHMASTIYHLCGTTAMGADNATSVVDSDLKVHGIGHLRVVDAGVFPSTISGHTNAATVMVAEKIADAIKRQYGYSISL